MRQCSWLACNADTADPSVAVIPSVESSPTLSEAVLMQNDTKDVPNDANHESAKTAEERSAADYDPTVDMQEDLESEDHRNNVGEMAAGAYNETEANDKEVLHAGSTDGTQITSQPKTKKSVIDDMFASEDEDEDDMFAAPVAPKKLSGPDAEPAKCEPHNDLNLRDNWDDLEGYYRVTIGEQFGDKYIVKAVLGRGIFSSVVRAQDKDTGRLVAIKIIRNNEPMQRAAVKEIEILQKLVEVDPEDKKHVVRLIGSFTYRGHLCMVFENLSLNLREVLKKFGHDVGLNLKAVRAYAGQMFLALSLFRKCNIIHADLKPDNVLVNEARSTLKICDLGSAADYAQGDSITPYLVSRFYRAPEIILGIKYDYAIDMWSIGCTLFELYTSKILFTGHNNNQMLRSMMECRGKFSLKMLKKAAYGGKHFDDTQQLQFRSIEKEKVTGRDVFKMMTFTQPTKPLKERMISVAERNGADEAEKKELLLFVDLLDRCLALNPEKRITPTEAMKHPFMQRGSGAASGSKFGKV